MAKTKKFSILLCSFLLVLASFLFASCGTIDYSKTKLSSSSEYIEIFVGEEKNLTITIENPVGNMSKMLTYTASSDKCSVVETTHKDYSTIYTLTGKEGGRSTIDFMAVDGGAKTTVEVLVRQYSETLGSSTKPLFITENSPLVPTKADFVFDDNVSERELDFFFYGKYVDGQKLDLEDVQLPNEEYYNQFVSASLKGQDGKKYLIFTDANGDTFTMSAPNVNNYEKVNFISAELVGDDYDFTGGNPIPVYPGDEFVFLARYVSISATKDETELFAVKKVSIFDTIAVETNIETDNYIYYKDKNVEDTSYDASKKAPAAALTVDGMTKGVLTLIPNYTKDIKIGGADKTADFLTAYIKVELPEYNPLLKIKAYSEDTDVVTGKFVGSNAAKDEYWYEINCAQGNKSNTNFVIQFYYEGFEDSTEAEVNYKHVVPVEIRNVPNSLFINNEEHKKGDNDTASTYTFYNYYAGNAGWVPFNFMINPTSAEYEKFEINLEGSGLVARYQGKTYGGDGQDQIIPVTDLSQTLYIRGKDGVTATANRKLSVNITVDFIGADVLTFNFNYKIINGATKLKFKENETAQWFKENGLYLDINSAAQLFEGMLVALDEKDQEAGFEYITVKHDKATGDDIAEITQAELGKLDLLISPKGLDEDVKYYITLDNGVELEAPIAVTVKESLTSAFVETENAYGLIKIPSEEANTYYIYNDGINLDSQGNTKTVDFHVYSNESRDSKAIEDVKIRLLDSSVFAVYNQSANGRNFNLQIRQNGKLLSSVAEKFIDNNGNGIYDEHDDYVDLNDNGIFDEFHKGLVVEIEGCSISDFRQESIVIAVPLNLYAYSFIEGISVMKDDKYNPTEANSVKVYTNVNSIDLRQVDFTFDVIHPEIDNAGSKKLHKGYLFKNEVTGEYEAAEFNSKYFYWEISKIGETNFLYYPDENSGLTTSSCSIDEGDFILDARTGKLTFIARNVESDIDREISLLTHVRQYGKLFTYTTKITIQKYEPVEKISLQTPVKEIPLSANKREFSTIVVPSIGVVKPTKPIVDIKISYLPENSDHKYENSLDYTVFYDEEGTRNTQVVISLSDAFLAELNEFYSTTKLDMRVKFFARDWLNQDNIDSAYASRVLEIPIVFENGSEDARFTISTAEDLEAVKDNLAAHYKVSGIIDASSIRDKLPLGVLTGSIIGIKDFSKIYGLNFNDPNKSSLFESIGTDAYIYNLSFEGSFNWSDSPTVDSIGLIARKNYGTIENVGVVLNKSTFTLANQKFGVIVGENYGIISQNFKRYDMYELNEDGSYVINNGQPKPNALFSKIYTDCAPKTLVYMKEQMTITVGADNAIIGGVVGLNGTLGEITKTDSYAVYYGYTNYMAYVDITVSDGETQKKSIYYIGGIAGKSEGTISATKVQFTNGTGTTDDDTISNGLLVGGSLKGDSEDSSYVGGVAGQITNGKFVNITTRTFVEGQSAALIANVPSDSSLNSSNLSGLIVEAIDDGKLGKSASMGITYSTTPFSKIEQIFFGPLTSIDELKPSNYSYITRTPIGLVESDSDPSVMIPSNSPVEDTLSQDVYYGDFIVIKTENDIPKLANVYMFESASEKQLNVSENFNNKMTAKDSNVSVFYGYFFKVDRFAANIEEDLSEWQNEFELTMNTLNVADAFYPFKSASREVKFSSLTPDVLTIAQDGTLTIKSTGLAHIQATSLLNSNSGLDFYVYVTNYIQTESSLANAQRSSIIYPNTSPSSVPLNETTIDIRGDNTANLYILPKYDCVKYNYKNEVVFASDRFGNAHFNGIAFSLVENQDVTANISFAEEDNGKLIPTLSGQTIYIKRGNISENEVVSLNITPIIKCEINNKQYFATVNKSLSQVSVDYKKGAVDIVNMKYLSVPIYSAAEVNDEIRVKSTANEEQAPKFQILDSKKNIIQDNLTEGSSGNGLFRVIFTAKSIKPEGGNSTTSYVEEKAGQTFYDHWFNLAISINKDSYGWKNRYNENIYGLYTIKIYASSNSAQSVSFDLNFGQTEIVSVPIDNYTKLKEAVGTLPSKSEKAYPGESGLLEITVSPEDADFDSIIIENDAMNYTTGHANAVFTLLARKQNPEEGDNLFDSIKITGSQGVNGLEINFDDIVNLYTKGTAYVDYKGIIYIQYDFSSENVLNDSISRINVRFMKKGQSEPLEEGYKDLTIKLQQFVGIELENKQKTDEGNQYYSAYTVARGLKYKIRVNTYGFDANSVSIVSQDPSLGTIVKESDGYYLQISPNVVSSKNSFEIQVSAQNEERNASSLTKIIVKDYVLEYNSEIENPKKPDIIEKMGNNVINIQVGNQITLAIDLYDYIEYDSTNSEVVTMIRNFLYSLAEKADWTAYTNLFDDETPNDNKGPDPEDESLKQYKVGYNNTTGAITNINYYFRSAGLKVIPVHTHSSSQERNYYFTLSAFYKPTQTGYVAVTKSASPETSVKEVSTEFMFNVYTSSSAESPVPISNYRELIENIHPNGYYILTSDITLPAVADESTGLPAFSPLEGNFASFDGNGYTLKFEGEYDFASAEEFGVFKSISEDSIVKNLTVDFAGKGKTPVVIKTSAENFNFGGIAGSNSGSITNCYVFSSNESILASNVTVSAPNAINGVSFIAGIAASNSGYITNSSVKINLQSVYYIAGVVANNNGKIAACAYKGGTLMGTSTNQRVAGFAYSNAANGQIITSYVSGERSATEIYSSNCNITSTQPVAGFIYENSGFIKDCYSDAYLKDSKASKAGFVYSNGGTIKNCFSLSILTSNNEASAGFVMSNTAGSETGQLVNCYYFYDPTNAINIALAQVDSTFGITRLTKEDFGSNGLSRNFAEYSYSQLASTKAIWFYSNAAGTSEEGLNGQTLPIGRLELVAPNIYTYSRRILDPENEEKDPNTGEIIYHYYDSTSAPDRGSISNPHLISTAQDMEALIYENATSGKLNTDCYRIINDINYSAEETGIEGYSKLYKVTYAGVLEGNGMEISDIGLVSMDNLSKGGLFGQVGYSKRHTGSIKNLVVSPKEVAFSSTQSVGTIAGVLSYGYLYDVEVGVSDSLEGKSFTVTGLNFVGGVVGRAVKDYEMKDVYSNVNASAGNDPSNYDTMYTDESADIGQYSYAGAIAGFLGKGKTYNMYVYNVSSVMGGSVGFAFGAVGKSATAEYTFVNIQSNAKIRAYNFGGFVAGEVAGTLKGASVNGSGQKENAIFLTIPKAAKAVGGITGRLSGGRVEDAAMNQDFTLPYNEDTKQIEIVGGLIGLVKSTDAARSYLVDSVMSASIATTTNLGGAIGQVGGSVIIDSVAVNGAELAITGPKSNPTLGGIVARVATNAGELSISNAYTTPKLVINTYTSGIESLAKVGGFIGSIQDTTLSMKSSYSSCVADVTIVDSRKVGEPIDYTTHVGAAGSTETPPKEISYQQMIHSGANISEVYYLGNSEMGSGADAFGNSNKFIQSFKYKVRAVTLGLQVNQVGTSTLNFNPTSPGVEALNGLFGADYDYYDTDTGKHFLLRYDGSKYVAYDDVRMYLTENFFYEKNTGEDPFAWTGQWWYRVVGVNEIEREDLISNGFYPTGKSYNGKELYIATTYRYYPENDEVALFAGEEIKYTHQDTNALLSRAYTVYDLVQQQFKVSLATEYGAPAPANEKKVYKYKWTGNEYALLYESDVHGTETQISTIMIGSTPKYRVNDGYLQKYNTTSNNYENITLNLKQVKMGEYITSDSGSWKVVEEVNFYNFTPNPNNTSQLDCIQLKNDSTALATAYCTDSVNKEDLVMMGLYKDADLNIYKSGYDSNGILVYKNIQTGEVFEDGKKAYEYNGSKFVAEDGEEIDNTKFTEQNYRDWKGANGETIINDYYQPGEWNDYWTNTSSGSRHRTEDFCYEGKRVTVTASGSVSTIYVHESIDLSTGVLQLVWDADPAAKSLSKLGIEKELNWIYKLDWFKNLKNKDE